MNARLELLTPASASTPVPRILNRCCVPHVPSDSAAPDLVGVFVSAVSFSAGFARRGLGASLRRAGYARQ